MAQLEKTGRVEWVSDLAEIPAKYGVNNVYGDLGQLFASTLVAQPRLATFIVATLLKGLGPDRVVWGTDALWTGSPQWQIEGLRRHGSSRRHAEEVWIQADGRGRWPHQDGNFQRQQRAALQLSERHAVVEDGPLLGAERGLPEVRARTAPTCDTATSRCDGAASGRFTC